MKRILLFLASAALMFAADISGTWAFQVETEMGSGSPTFTFKQDGEKLTGTYKGQLGEAPLTGQVSGENVNFSFEISPQGDKVTVKYAGVVDGSNKIKGTVDFAGMGKGTFSGTKQ